MTTEQANQLQEIHNVVVVSTTEGLNLDYDLDTILETVSTTTIGGGQQKTYNIDQDCAVKWTIYSNSGEYYPTVNGYRNEIIDKWRCMWGSSGTNTSGITYLQKGDTLIISASSAGGWFNFTRYAMNK